MTHTLYVFRGPCGAGKSWLRTILTSHFDSTTETIGTVDMENAPRDGGYTGRLVWLEEQLYKQKKSTTTVLLEGIFAPGTPSWRSVQDIAARLGYVLIHITICRPKFDCLEAVKADPVRTKFVYEYHPKFV